ncbi:unspecified product [Leishmania tarentolae]|uniref:Unspecified product n=1 Tax=Leishmania tarentolae TaxID=5689 RepID=A0A640KF28_LEITA|nr:unspecified product [Leishmania tarentolae]
MTRAPRIRHYGALQTPSCTVAAQHDGVQRLEATEDDARRTGGGPRLGLLAWGWQASFARPIRRAPGPLPIIRTTDATALEQDPGTLPAWIQVCSAPELVRRRWRST